MAARGSARELGLGLGLFCYYFAECCCFFFCQYESHFQFAFIFSSLCQLFQFQLQLLLARFSRYASIWRVFPQIFHFSAQLINRPVYYLFTFPNGVPLLLSVSRVPRATAQRRMADYAYATLPTDVLKRGSAWLGLCPSSLSSLVSLFSPLLLLFLSSAIYVKRNAKVQPIGNCQLRANL